MFCKFLVCHGFDLFFCQAMALLVLPEKKIHEEKKIRIRLYPSSTPPRPIHMVLFFSAHFHLRLRKTRN